MATAGAEPVPVDVKVGRSHIQFKIGNELVDNERGTYDTFCSLYKSGDGNGPSNFRKLLGGAYLSSGDGYARQDFSQGIKQEPGSRFKIRLQPHRTE